jgi:hypothetical protein
MKNRSKETQAPLAAYVLIGGTGYWAAGSFAPVNPHKVINGCRRLLKELQDSRGDKKDPGEEQQQQEEEYFDAGGFKEDEETSSFKYLEGPRREEVVLRIVSLFRYTSLSGRCPPRLPKDLRKAGARNDCLRNTWAVYWALLFIHSGRVEEWINVDFETNAEGFSSREAAAFFVCRTWGTDKLARRRNSVRRDRKEDKEADHDE